MSIALIVGILAILVIVVIAVVQRSGPRVTIIKEEPKDDRDA
jgi:hypothetical protein